MKRMATACLAAGLLSGCATTDGGPGINPPSDQVLDLGGYLALIPLCEAGRVEIAQADDLEDAGAFTAGEKDLLASYRDGIAAQCDPGAVPGLAAAALVPWYTDRIDRLTDIGRARLASAR